MAGLSSIQFLVIGSVGILAAAFGAIIFVMRRFGDDSASDRLNQFVNAAGTTPASDDGKRQQVLDDVDKALSQSKGGSKIARDLARADLKLRVVEFYGLKVVSAIFGVIVGAFLGRADPLALASAAVIGGIVFLIIPDFYLGFRAQGRIKAFNNQLGDTITMMANALRGGYSFLQTMDMVSKEAPSPIADEFNRVVQEVGLGRTTEDALSNLLRRVPSEDLDLLITAVNIQHEVGGNLAQILDTIGHTIRERVRIKGEIQTLTAQGKISGYVITGLPFLLAFYISAVNPDYMAPMFTFGFPPRAWCCLPVTSVVMIAIGYWAIMKIVDIEV